MNLPLSKKKASNSKFLCNLKQIHIILNQEAENNCICDLCEEKNLQNCSKRQKPIYEFAEP